MVAAGFVLAPAVACQSGPTMGGAPRVPEEQVVELPPGFRVETFAEGLDIVWGIVFRPDGSALVTERPGRIRLLHSDGRLDPTPWAVIEDVRDRGEGGLMGIALHPDFPEHPWVYVMYTSGERGTVNRVARIRDKGGQAGRVEIVLDDLPARSNHNGGRIAFGPDGFLYIGAGEVWQRNRAQDTRDLGGSVLRIRADGTIPSDNPFSNAIFSYGHRNVQGIAWHPATGALFTAEHGPSGEWSGVRGHDEINITEKGKNYGWPLAVGASGTPGLEDPLLVWPNGAPTGDLLFYDGSIAALSGDLFYATLGSEVLFRIRFQDPANPHRVTAIERWFEMPTGQSVYGRLRGMAVGPDGALYVGTSNKSRGSVRAGDDKILRISFVAPPPP